jgi:hypothetical protein
MNNKNSFLKLIIFGFIISYAIYFIYTYFVFILTFIVIYIVLLLQKYKLENKSLNSKITILNVIQNKKVFKKFQVIKITNMNIINNVVEVVEMQKNICVVCNIYCKKKCERCKTAYYCCIEHQRENWSYHKKICQSILQQ